MAKMEQVSAISGAPAAPAVPRRERRLEEMGPYLSERQRGTVREDYSAGGDAWNYFLHDQVRFARLPLGRGRARRAVRRPPALRCGSRGEIFPTPFAKPRRKGRHRRW